MTGEIGWPEGQLVVDSAGQCLMTSEGPDPPPIPEGYCSKHIFINKNCLISLYRNILFVPETYNGGPPFLRL